MKKRSARAKMEPQPAGLPRSSRIAAGILCLLLFALLPAGCGSKPAPVWIAAGHQQLESFKTGFLTGRPPLVTEMHFKKAVEEIKKGGDLDLLGKAWLTRMALQAAVLGNIEEEDFRKIEAARSVPANRNFHLFLKGEAAAVDPSLLPAQYRPFLAELRSGNAGRAEKAIAAIEDPLSRLIAAGLAVGRGLENEGILKTAVENASLNGWKRALLVWMERLEAFYAAQGRGVPASEVRKRIDLTR